MSNTNAYGAGTAQGVVEYIGQKGKAWNVKMSDGQWYGHGFKQPSFGKGDHVKFEYTVNGNFKNITVNSVTKSAAAPAPATAPEVNKYTNGTVAVNVEKPKQEYWDNKDARITFLACRNTAVEIVRLAIDKEAIKMPAKTADKLNVIMASLDEVADMLYTRATTGKYLSSDSKEENVDRHSDPVSDEDD